MFCLTVVVLHGGEFSMRCTLSVQLQDVVQTLDNHSDHANDDHDDEVVTLYKTSENHRKELYASAICLECVSSFS
eukprot:5265-Heterococcus_DN1.PRE.16